MRRKAVQPGLMPLNRDAGLIDAEPRADETKHLVKGAVPRCTNGPCNIEWWRRRRRISLCRQEEITALIVSRYARCVIHEAFGGDGHHVWPAIARRGLVQPCDFVG